MMQTPSDPLNHAEELLRSGHKADARELLANYLKGNPDSAKGWWLMSYAVEDLDHQYECLERVLELYPHHRKAQKRLDALRGEILPAKGPLAKLQQSSLSPPIIALIVVLGCVGLAVIGFVGYQLFLPGQSSSPTQAVITEADAPSPTVAGAADQFSITDTPAIATTITQTPVPEATHTPLISSTPTVDPNATPTPISENQIGTSVGEYPPDFTLINAITNEEVNLYDYFGQPVLIVFLNTLAKECDPEMPGLQTVYEKYQEQGLVVLGVGVGSSQSALRNYTGRFGGLTFPLLSDWEHTIANSYDVSGVPTNFFIRKNGKIWQVSYGAMKEETLDAVVGSILRMP
jgi:peroxiredoxin